MDPERDLSSRERLAWLESAGPRFRMRSHDLVLAGHMLYYIAVDGTRECGYMTAYASRRRNFITLLRLWVDLDVQRRSVATQLVEHALFTDPRPTTVARVPWRNVAAQLFLQSMQFSGVVDPDDSNFMKFSFCRR
jgi:hypothetical protein